MTTELAATLLAALAIIVTLLGVAWTGGRKIGSICARLTALQERVAELTRRINVLEQTIRLGNPAG